MAHASYRKRAGRFDVANRHVQYGASGDGEPTPIPLPAAAWMGLLTLAGLGASRRKASN